MRNCDGQPEFAMRLVQRGYVAVSIDYRQLGDDYNMSASDVPEVAATEDARADVIEDAEASASSSIQKSSEKMIEVVPHIQRLDQKQIKVGMHLL